MESIDQWRWITLYEYLQRSPFESPEETLKRVPHNGEREEHKIGDQVILRMEGLHWLIVAESGTESEETVEGTIVGQQRITEVELSRFREEQSKFFTPAFTPILDRVFDILKKMYLNRTVYCVHLTELLEQGSDLFFTLPWPFPEQFIDSICSEHGRPELRSLHYTCHLLSI